MKKIKIYDVRDRMPNAWHSVRHHQLPFDVEPEWFEYTSDKQEADIMVVIPNTDPDGAHHQMSCLEQEGYTGRVLLVNFFHTDESTYLVRLVKQWNDYGFKTTAAHTNMHNPNFIRHDFLHERNKIYFRYKEFGEDILSRRLWIGEAKETMFDLGKIEFHKPNYYIAPMRIYPGIRRSFYRQRLKDFLTQHKNKGIVTDHEAGIFLDPQEDQPPESLFYQKNDSGSIGAGTWMPIHNKYYRTSVASIYVETLTEEYSVRCITEKTWDPIVKGHFILPFGYKGMISDIKDFGYKLPDFIDYSYDSLSDWERFDGYLKSVEAFLSIPKKQLRSLAYNNIKILEYNRNRILTQPLEKLGPKVRQWLDES